MVNKFDKIISRNHSDATKWTKLDSIPESIPLWLADMDFATSIEIQNAIKKRAEHPIFGYTDRGQVYNELITKHFNNRHNYEITPDEVFMTTGVVYSMCGAVRLFSNENDKIIVHTPVYPPFREIVEKNNRRIVESPMIQINERYSFDFDNLEKIVDKDTTMFLLCNPHNPTGRIFDEDELIKLAKFCEKYNLFIVSDEIHADFAYRKKMIPIMKTTKYARNHSVTCISCSKSFNLAGLKVSAVIIPSRKSRKKFIEYSKITGIASINIFALEGLKAAYAHQKSEEWQIDLVNYLEKNKEFCIRFLTEKLPKLKILKPEGTYFMWIDFNMYKIKNIHDKLLCNAKVLLNEGSTFGKEYKGFERLNFACPKKQLKVALNRIVKFIEEETK